MSETDHVLIFDSSYLSLWSDGIIGISDGCGFVGSIEGDELLDLYKALQSIYGEKDE